MCYPTAGGRSTRGAQGSFGLGLRGASQHGNGSASISSPSQQGFGAGRAHTQTVPEVKRTCPQRQLVVRQMAHDHCTAAGRAPRFFAVKRFEATIEAPATQPHTQTNQTVAVRVIPENQLCVRSESSSTIHASHRARRTTRTSSTSTACRRMSCPVSHHHCDTCIDLQCVTATNGPCVCVVDIRLGK